MVSEDWQPLFYRGLAVVLMVLGLYVWASIIGVVAPTEGGAFSDLSGAKRAAIFNMAVAYPVAATGLWMLTPWGVVVWLYAAGFEIITHTVFAGTFGFRPFPVALHGALVGIYAVLVLASRRAANHAEARERAERIIRPEDRPVGTGRFTAGARQRLAKTLARRRGKETPAPAVAEGEAQTSNE